MRNITAFEPEWYSYKSFRKVKTLVDVDVVLEKKINNVHATVHLENIETPGRFPYHSGGNSVLIDSVAPKDSDGTKDDEKKKIEEVIHKIEKIWDKITEDQIIGLKNAFKSYEEAVDLVYSRMNEVGK